MLGKNESKTIQESNEAMKLFLANNNSPHRRVCLLNTILNNSFDSNVRNVT